ncbi:GNAT family N-acetyltransferase [Actinomycetaceae bacterium TAE3-ERU4]|nr:GNAT family N-acetyltransferase [Actinomycetaceae bacterium TAE3-ERU4]
MRNNQLVIPEDTSTLRWRWLRESDVELVHALISTIEAADNPPYRTTLGETQQMFAQTANWVGLAGFDNAGNMRACIHSRLRLSSPIQVRTNSALHHDFRDGKAEQIMVDWQTQAGFYLTRLLNQDTECEIICTAEHQSDIFAHYLEKSAYTWSATLYEMRGGLSVLPESKSPAPLVSIEHWNTNLEDMVRLAALDFAPEASNSVGRSFEHWMSNRENFAPELSFIALDKSTDRTRVAGFVMCAAYAQDWEVLGWQEGYIDLLEVGKNWRNTNVARELIVAAMAACKNEGYQKIATAVSSNHEAELVKLFGSLGFEGVDQERFYTLRLEETNI